MNNSAFTHVRHYWMKELEAEMDNVILASYSQSALAPPSFHSYQYAAYQPYYSSLPHLELVCPTQCPRLNVGDLQAPLASIRLSSIGISPSSTVWASSGSGFFDAACTSRFAATRLCLLLICHYSLHPLFHWRSPAPPVPPASLMQIAPAPALAPAPASVASEKPYTAFPRCWQSAPKPYPLVQDLIPLPVQHSYLGQLPSVFQITVICPVWWIWQLLHHLVSPTLN